jgi:uncharacterized protein YggU (UPF0235/DUF167 family)
VGKTTIRVSVKPRSRERVLERGEDGNWVARLTSPPVDGKANEELVALVADCFGCPKSAVRIRSGASARVKILEVLAPG